MTVAYDELIDFIAAGVTPKDLIDFRPSDETKQKVDDLIARQKREGLSPDETEELAHFLKLEHLMRLAKARARRHVTDQ